VNGLIITVIALAIVSAMFFIFVIDCGLFALLRPIYKKN